MLVIEKSGLRYQEFGLNIIFALHIRRVHAGKPQFHL